MFSWSVRIGILATTYTLREHGQAMIVASPDASGRRVTVVGGSFSGSEEPSSSGG